MKYFENIPSPCYVIEENKLRRNLEIINNISKEAEVEFILAFKGFAMWKVFPIVREYVNGATASSLFEAKLAFDEMKCKPHTYAPVYLDNEFDEIATLSSHVTFNSIAQFEKFRYRGKKINPEISYGLRVNPGYSPVKTSLYNPASELSRLGVSSENLGEKLPMEIDGLHFHALCENNSHDLENVLTHFINRYEKYFHQLKWVNFGGGHLVSHIDYDLEHLIQLLKKFREKYKLNVILEPGSAFAWQTGFLLSTVQDIINHEKMKTAMLDVSFTAHMPDCLEMPYKPDIRDASNEGEGFVYRMGGVSCLAGDYMGDWYFKNELKNGDQVIFEDMIHYTMVKTTMFNGVFHPSIGILEQDSEFKLLKQFSYDDYKNRLC